MKRIPRRWQHNRRASFCCLIILTKTWYYLNQTCACCLQFVWFRSPLSPYLDPLLQVLWINSCVFVSYLVMRSQEGMSVNFRLALTMLQRFHCVFRMLYGSSSCGRTSSHQMCLRRFACLGQCPVTLVWSGSRLFLPTKGAHCQERNWVQNGWTQWATQQKSQKWSVTE